MIFMRPLHDRVLIKEDKKEETSKGGIIIPQSAEDGKMCVTATVVKVGTGKVLESGQVLTPDVKVGDKIILGKYHGTEVVFDGEKHRIVKEEHIDGVFE